MDLAPLLGGGGDGVLLYGAEAGGLMDHGFESPDFIRRAHPKPRTYMDSLGSNTIVTELPTEVRNWFTECGWSPDHKAEVPSSVPTAHPAHAVLSTFGGITLLERECPNDDEPIQEFTFMLLSTTDDRIRKWSSRLKSVLVGIADEHNSHAELYMDEQGRCFSHSLIHDCFAFAGSSLVDTLIGCLTNRRHRALLAPFQQQVCIYGEWLQRGDPRIWDYSLHQ